MIAKSYRLALSTVILLVKCSHALSTVCVYFYGSVVNFAKSLQFNVVAPDPRVALSMAVVGNFLVCNEHLEVFFA